MNKQEFKSAFSVYLTACGIFVPLIALSAFVLIEKGKGLTPLLICVGLWAVTLYWIWSQRILIDGKQLIYRGAFFFKRSVDLEDIKQVRLVAGSEGAHDRFLPSIRLVVETRATPEKDFWLNAKLFSGDDLRAVLALGKSRD